MLTLLVGAVTVTGFNPNKDSFTFSNQLTTSVSYHDDAHGNAVITVDNAGGRRWWLTRTLILQRPGYLLPLSFVVLVTARPTIAIAIGGTIALVIVFALRERRAGRPF
jgi:hypothetical protein